MATIAEADLERQKGGGQRLARLPLPVTLLRARREGKVAEVETLVCRLERWLPRGGKLDLSRPFLEEVVGR